ncbi:MAG TPA: hypothetical protein VJ672_11405 [Gemmatimonadaceae bacterium]|nr:hypothetical protein [Gemmatimonadaceae bacterium]
MRARLLLAGMTACLAFAACSETATAPEFSEPTVSTARQTVGPIAIPLNLTGTNGTFQGTLSITSFAVNSAGNLVANGTLVGTSVVNGVTSLVNTTFTNLQVTPGQRCQILFLDIQPIFLNLLGLQLTTSRITLDLTAVAGPGNLLGNLLCALVGLLDGTAPLSSIQSLLSQINALLG